MSGLSADFASKLKQLNGSAILSALLSGGKIQILKRSLVALLGAYALWAILKNHGWLPKKSVRDQHILITGSGSGIGRQMAIRFAKLGAKITIVDLNVEGANKVNQEIQALSLKSQAFKLDVSNAQNVKEVFAQAIESFGIIDILINNAGIVSGKKLLDNTEFMIDKTIAVNTTSHHYTVRASLPGMLQQNKGHIVTVASIAGQTGVAGLVDYCASKFGAVGFDESLRMEMRKQKKNIKTTCVCPYFINTGMFDGVKTKFSLLLPILEEDYASNRIVNAVLQNEPMLVMPWFLNVGLFLRSFLPTSASDLLMELFGASNTMDDFKGRIAH